MADSVAVYIVSWGCQKSDLESKNKKIPTNLLFFPPTQTPNYNTSSHFIYDPVPKLRMMSQKRVHKNEPNLAHIDEILFITEVSKSGC